MIAYSQIPCPSDSLATVKTKLAAILSKLVSSQNIATVTSFVNMPDQDYSPIVKATREMNGHELVQ